MESFDAAKEPLRAIRDLVRECEGIFDEDNEQHVLERARVALAALRALFGDDRPSEEVAYGPLIEPHLVPELDRPAPRERFRQRD